MGLDDLDARLSALDDAFKDAPSESQFERKLPEPGDYSTNFREVDFFEGKATGAAFLKIVLEVILDPDYAGWEIEMIYNLEPHLAAIGDPKPDREEVERKLGFLKRDLKRLGVDVDGDDFSLAMVRPGSPMWDDLIGHTVDVAVRESKTVNPNTKKPYVNCYINGISEPIGSDIGPQSVPGVGSAVAQPQSVASPVATDDDDIPF